MADQEPNGPVMLPAQRQDRILAEIERAGGARIAQLAEQLSVSEMTVRRDIDALARQGLIKKVYGGATAPARSTSDEPGFEVKSHRELAAKDQIGAVAATLIQPSTTVAISAGTTTYAAAVHLARIPGLTVVTNSVQVADYLHVHGDRSQTVLLTGGVRTPSDALVGPIAVQTISGLHVDALLLGVHGMDPAAGFTTPNLMEAEMNRAMVAAAGRLIVLADHTKWGVVGLCAMARLADASVLVSDEGLGAEARDVLDNSVGELMLAGAGDTAGLLLAGVSGLGRRGGRLEVTGCSPGQAGLPGSTSCSIASRVTVVLALYAGSGWGRADFRALIRRLEPAEDGARVPSRTRA